MSGSESWPRKRELTCMHSKKPDDNREYFTHNNKACIFVLTKTILSILNTLILYILDTSYIASYCF